MDIDSTPHDATHACTRSVLVVADYYDDAEDITIHKHIHSSTPCAEAICIYLLLIHILRPISQSMYCPILNDGVGVDGVMVACRVLI
jgi:hypothetical protein